MIKENLKKLRKHFGLSVAKFAEKIDIPAVSLTNYERGERTPSAHLFIQLHTKLNVNLNWLVSGKGEMFNAPPFDAVKTELRSEVLQILKEQGLI